jgi:hypothetical protein
VLEFERCWNEGREEFSERVSEEGDDMEFICPDSGILIVWDSDAIRRINLTPRSPNAVIMDPILPTHDKFPIIEFGISQYMAPLLHRLSFPPTRRWGVAEFDPESLYWLSSEEALAILFCQAFQNYLLRSYHSQS